LCTRDDTAAFKLGKQRQRQVINLKILLTKEKNAARQEDIMNKMTALLPGIYV
jgi:hypothetical protein